MAKYISVTKADEGLQLIKLADTKEYGHSYFPVLCSDGLTRYAQLGESSDDNVSDLWIKQNGVKKYVIRQPNVALSVYLTMGGYMDIYGFSNIGTLKFGAISGTFTYNSKTVTVVMFEFYAPYVDFVMQVDGETSGTYNANVTLIDPDTDKKEVYILVTCIIRATGMHLLANSHSIAAIYVIFSQLVMLERSM